MTDLHNPENKVLMAKRMVESNDNSHIRLNANGGNSVLIVCEPSRESEYIAHIRKLLTADKYELIDLNDLLCKFISDNRMNLDDSFELLKGSVSQVFKAPAGEDSPDLFKSVLQAVNVGYSANRIPVLLHSGALYGSGIENIHIIESELVMKASLPLIILYPAVREGDKLMFLGSRPSSKYRCMIIE